MRHLYNWIFLLSSEACYRTLYIYEKIPCKNFCMGARSFIPGQSKKSINIIFKVLMEILAKKARNKCLLFGNIHIKTSEH